MSNDELTWDDHTVTPTDGNGGPGKAYASRIINQARDGVIVFSPEGTVEYVNPRVTNSLSHTRSELIGTPLQELATIGAIGAEEVEPLRDAIATVSTDDVAEVSLDLHPDHPATDTVYNLRLSRLDVGNERPRVLGVSRNITQQTDYERTAEQVAEAVRGLDAAETKPAVAEVCVDIATDILDQSLTTAFLYDEDSTTLEPVSTSAPNEPPAFDPGNGIVGTVYTSGTKATLDDAAQDPRTIPYDSTTIGGCTALPLGDHGVLVFASLTRGTLGSAALKLAAILAANTETALDRVEREQQLRESETRLRRQNQRLDQFTSIVSHDLRNPVTVASGHAELLADTLEDSDRVDKLIQALDRMDDLVEDLLALAKSGEDIDDCEWVSLSAVVEECWSTVATKEATLRCEVSKSVYAHQFRLKQLFENLIGNAIQHGGKDVSVEIGDVETGFYITDSGPGIPRTVEDSLFEPGVTTDPEGTGYGLNIVTAVVSAHGWTIEHVASDTGARFEITGVETRPTPN